MTTAQAAVATAQNTVTSAQAKADAAQSAVNATNSQIASTQAQIDAANQPVESVTNGNSISVSDAYVTAMKAYANASTSADFAKISTQLSTAGDKLADQMLNYKPDTAGEKIKINGYSDLTQPILQKLASFTAQLVNPIRAKFGVAPLGVTQISIDYATAVAKQYDADDWNPMLEATPHDLNGLAKVSADLLNETDATGENMSLGYLLPQSKSKWNYTLNDIESAIYQSILSMMFNDAGSAWGHSLNFLTLGVASAGDDYTDSIGFAVDNFGHTHFEFIQQDNTETDSKYGTPVNLLAPKTTDTTALKATLATFKNNLTTETAALTTANASLASAKNTLTNAKSALATKQAAATKAATAVTTAQTAKTAADKAVTAAKAAVTTAQQKLTDIENALADPAAFIKSKTDALSAAQDALTAAQAKLAADSATAKDKATTLQTVNTALATAQAKQAADQKTLDADNAALKQAQAKLAALQNADQNLADAQNALETAQNDLVEAQEVLDNATAANNNAQAEAQEAQAAATAATAQYQAALKAYNALKARDAERTKLIAAVDRAAADAKAAKVQLATKTAAEAQDSASPARMANKSANAQYPQTGDAQNSVLAMAGVVLMSLLGLLGFGKKYKHSL